MSVLRVILFVPFLALCVVHLLCLAVDDVVFRRYRKIHIRRPIFIVGVPRSGTTTTHRLLSADPSLTTFTTWECFLAPSILQRHLVRSFQRFDIVLGRPLGRLLDTMEGRLWSSMESIHPMRLSAPEEDYLSLFPYWMCSILLIPFPSMRWLWSVTRLDTLENRWPARVVMHLYRRQLQRHLYFHGDGKRLLSKNAAFAGCVGSLHSHFPDARFIVCERDAWIALQSQLCSIDPACAYLQTENEERRTRLRLAENFPEYYRNLDRLMQSLPECRLYRLPLWRLSREKDRVAVELSGFVLDTRRSAEREPIDNSHPDGYSEPLTPASAVPGVSVEILDALQPWRHAASVRL